MTKSRRGAAPSEKLRAFVKWFGLSVDRMRSLEEAGDITPLHLAAETGQYELVRELIELGADANAVNASSEMTPLGFAVQHNHLDVAELLLEAGADPSRGTSVASLALQTGFEEMRILLELYRATFAEPQSSGPDDAILERIYNAMVTNPTDLAALVDELNREGVPPLPGGTKWDWFMVTQAADLHGKRRAGEQTEVTEQGGALTLEIDDIRSPERLPTQHTALCIVQMNRTCWNSAVTTSASPPRCPPRHRRQDHAL